MTRELKDPQIAYWASLCESDVEEKKLDETYEEPYCWDVVDNNIPIETVKDLKEALSHFKDEDTLCILSENDSTHDIKAMWNANMEYEMTGGDTDDNICFIRID